MCDANCVAVAPWAIADSPTSPTDKQPPSYFGGSMRGRNIQLTPWGAGPEPADHEFMRRLFRRWDVDGTKSLTLQNLVNGFAAIKGTRDIMANIAYFFDLHDDDGDGKIDRDGILKMSEALLFLGRKGYHTDAMKSPTLPPQGQDQSLPTLNEEERYLAAVSAFIRRCFEYADPESALNAAAVHQPGTTDGSVDQATKDMDAFAIGDDEDEDIPDSPAKSRSRGNTLPKASSATTQNSDVASLSLPPVPSETKPNTHQANIALDPAKPLFITLPTFRMVILADEVLEAFFDTGFANTLHLADQPIPSTASSFSSLTTFANLGRGSGAGAVAGTPIPPTPLVPVGKGLRGMLDGIVADGMRVAGEVRRRVEDIQGELDRSSSASGAVAEDDDDEGDGGKSLLDVDMGGPTDHGRKSSETSRDGELLEGADAQATGERGQGVVEGDLLGEERKEGDGERLVEFER